MLKNTIIVFPFLFLLSCIQQKDKSSTLPELFNPVFTTFPIKSSIRAIEDYNSLHLLYTKELDTVSLFQQSSHTQEGLSAQDFRDYAVYCSQEPDTDVKIKGMGTILAWSNSTIAFVLIGDADLSELMKMVPSINQYNK